jgi:glycosyltransferase involved in cell wall biosynthesis
VKVLHVITTLERGGGENHLVQLVTGQIAVGLEVKIVYLKGRAELVSALCEAGASVHKATKIRTLLAILRRDFDLVHAHLPRAELASLAIAGMKPLFVTRHNAEPFWPGFALGISRFLSHMVDKRSSRIIAISNAVRDYLFSSHHTVRIEKVRVVPYGFAVPEDHQLDPYKHVPACKDRLITIGVVARLTPQKDLPTLFRAVALLTARGHDIQVQIAGAGPDKLVLEDLAIQLGLGSNVSFLGRIDNPVEFIARTDVFVLPSKYEGFGLVLLEASVAGVPIVAARNTAMAEVVVDGVSGLLFSTGNAEDLADKLDQVISDPELGRRLRDAAYERLVTVYNPEEMVARTIEVYEEALSEMRR